MISLAQPHIKDDFTAMMHWKRRYEYEHEARLLLEAEKAVLTSNLKVAEEKIRHMEEKMASASGARMALLDANRKLESENRKLCKELNRRNGKEGYFGSSTPSSKLPPHANSAEENQKKQGGAKPGHMGHGRKKIHQGTPAEKIVLDVMPEKCSCGNTLCLNGYEERSVMDYIPGKTVVKILCRRKGKCAACGKRYVSPVAEAAPRAFYTNKLLAHAAVEHYILGHSMGEVSAKLNASESALFNAFHLYAEQLTSFVDELIGHYRKSPVKHADETGWKCDGVNGYAWLFTNSSVAVHCFAHTRSQLVVDKIFGDKKLPGVLCVDRYAGYNHVKCKVQYCYAHLKRAVDDIKKEFPDDAEVIAFVDIFSPLLAQAMGLRGKKLDTSDFLAEALAIKEKILQAVNAEANHPGIQKIQNIFIQNELKLFHWAESPDIPADNNFAERDLRKTVIARKISYGSQSERGRKTRSVMMSILHTAQKNGRDPAATFEKILGELQAGNRSDLLKLLL